MEPLTGGFKHTQGPSFWSTVDNALRQASQSAASVAKNLAEQTDWHEVERDLRLYQEPFITTAVNDYSAWKTGQARRSYPDVLDGWEYDDTYTGKKPPARLLYINAAGALSDLKRRWNRGGGHVAVEIEGDVYNYTPEGLHIIPKRKNYIHMVTHRNQNEGPQSVYAYPLGLTAEEQRQLAHELTLYAGKPYNIKHRNCAHCTIDSLKKITANSVLPISKTIPALDSSITEVLQLNPYSPTDVLNDTRASQRIYGPIFVYQPPKQSRTWDNDLWGVP
jgi:hypothetical protein